MNPINYLKRLKSAIDFPVGVDQNWDKACEESFGRVLDVFYYFGIAGFITHAIVLFCLLAF